MRLMGETYMHTNTVTLSLKKREIWEKMPVPPTKRNLKRRHLTVTNQIRSVIEFSISAKLIRENITTASGTYLKEVISKNNTKAIQMPPLAEFLHKYAVKRYDVLLLPENML